MINDFFKKLTPQTQGAILIVFGILLLLNSIAAIPALNALVALSSLAIIWFGAYEGGYVQKIINMISKK